MRTFEQRLAGIAATACTALAASGALAATASAATITADKACYVNADPSSGAAMTITGTGFAPNDPVDLSGGGVFGQTTVDATGNFSILTAAPKLSTIEPGMTSTMLTAEDDNATLGAITATTVVKSANLSVSTTPGSVKNVRKDKVMFSFSGFTPGKHVYGYYMRKTVVAKARFGKASGPCGLLRQKALLFPGGRPSKDEYKVTFESSSRFSTSVFPRVTGTLNILHF
jgi:hypothetical protein